MNVQKAAINDRVFLGGTCNETTWREDLIPMLEIDYFNPIVDDWTIECQKNEVYEKENKCNIHLYVITSAMTGVFSIAEAVDSAHNKRVRTIFHVIPEGFDRGQLRSMNAVISLIDSLGGVGYIDKGIKATVNLLNNMTTFYTRR